MTASHTTTDDARIPDHCGWAARGRWREAYDAAVAELRKVTEERAMSRQGLTAVIEARDMMERLWRNEYIRAETAEAEVARLTAELAAARGRVKPLEWREVNDGNRRKGEVFGTRSPVSFAPITAHKKHDGWWLSADCKTYPTLEAAKAAAQADYAARILAALEPDPTMVRMREALEEIARQKRTDELETELDAEHADFEGGYDACIDRARAALQEE